MLTLREFDDWMFSNVDDEDEEDDGRSVSSRHCTLCGEWLDRFADWITYECSTCVLDEWASEDEEDDL